VFDDLKIRNKLILLVVGPLLVVVLLASMGARSRRDSAVDSARVAQQVTVAQVDSDAVDALQQEALYSTASIASGRDASRKELAQARSNTDKALAEALGRLRGDVAGTTAGYRSATGLAVDAVDKLTQIRQAVDQGYRWDQALRTYSSLQDTFLAVNTAIADS